MGKSVLKNVRLFTGGADLTTRNNKLEVMAEVEDKETTAFVPEGDVWREVLGGQASSKWSGEGQWEAEDPGKVDDVSWTDLGGLSAWTACPATAAVESVAWMTSAMRGSYQLGAALGDVAPWAAAAAGSWPTVRGVVLHDPGTARTATGNGAAVLHVAAPAGKQVYAALHVLSVAGSGTPTLTAKVQADNASNFPSPVDVVQFAAATARGGQILRTPGPLTDTYYRVSWTISGTTPSFLFLASVGIAP
jgi:hypothetical protein